MAAGSKRNWGTERPPGGRRGPVVLGPRGRWAGSGRSGLAPGGPARTPGGRPLSCGVALALPAVRGGGDRHRQRRWAVASPLLTANVRSALVPCQERMFALLGGG